MNNIYGFSFLAERSRDFIRENGSENLSLDGFLRNVLVPGDGFVAYYRGGMTCRETLVNCMFVMSYRLNVIMEANLTPWTEVTASGSEDLLSGQAFRELSATDKRRLTQLLRRIMGAQSLTVTVSSEDVLTVRYMNESYANPLKISSVLLVLRMLRGLIIVDQSNTFMTSIDTLVRTVLEKMDSLKVIYPEDNKGMSRQNLVLAMSGISSMNAVIGHSYAYSSNGPASYALCMGKEEWKAIIRKNIWYIDLYRNILTMYSSNMLESALLELTNKGAV